MVIKIEESFIGGYFHVYNRSTDKRVIFLDEMDFIRFLAAILIFQGADTSKYQLRRLSKSFVRPFRSDMLEGVVIDSINKSREVELVAFILMPTHFHLILRELKEGGISRFMSRVANSYTKYFNTKYKRKGPIFEGVFNSKAILDDDYLFYLSAYIHKNITEIKEWKDREWEYPWSSFSDYVKENRWGFLLKPEVILEQFKDAKDYQEFVINLPIKEVFDLPGRAEK